MVSTAVQKGGYHTEFRIVTDFETRFGNYSSTDQDNRMQELLHIIRECVEFRVVCLDTDQHIECSNFYIFYANAYCSLLHLRPNVNIRFRLQI